MPQLLIVLIFLACLLQTKQLQKYPDFLKCGTSQLPGQLLYLTYADTFAVYWLIGGDDRIFFNGDESYAGSLALSVATQKLWGSCKDKNLTQLEKQQRTFNLENSNLEKKIINLNDFQNAMKNEITNLTKQISVDLKTNVVSLTNSLKVANQQVQQLENQLIYIEATFNNIENGYFKANLIFGIISCVCAILAVIIYIIRCCLKMKESWRAQLHLQKAESSSLTK